MFYDGSVALEYTQDLHLKMSKKIAQLTKVCSCEEVNYELVNDVVFHSSWNVEERLAGILCCVHFAFTLRRTEGLMLMSPFNPPVRSCFFPTLV